MFLNPSNFLKETIFSQIGYEGYYNLKPSNYMIESVHPINPNDILLFNTSKILFIITHKDKFTKIETNGIEKLIEKLQG